MINSSPTRQNGGICTQNFKIPHNWTSWTGRSHTKNATIFWKILQLQETSAIECVVCDIFTWPIDTFCEFFATKDQLKINQVKIHGFPPPFPPATYRPFSQFLFNDQLTSFYYFLWPIGESQAILFQISYNHRKKCEFCQKMMEKRQISFKNHKKIANVKKINKKWQFIELVSCMPFNYYLNRQTMQI